MPTYYRYIIIQIKSTHTTTGVPINDGMPILQKLRIKPNQSNEEIHYFLQQYFGNTPGIKWTFMSDIHTIPNTSTNLTPITSTTITTTLSQSQSQLSMRDLTKKAHEFKGALTLITDEEQTPNTISTKHWKLTFPTEEQATKFCNYFWDEDIKFNQKENEVFFTKES